MRRIAIVLLLATAACGKGSNEAPAKNTDAETKLAHHAVQEYAFDAYFQWAAAHPEKACPEKLSDLDEYLGAQKAAKDPWGNPYKFYCGPTLPAGVKGAAVVSAGPDGQAGTPDDIKSWE